MIFVTVGTHEQPFNRLIQKVDELKRDGIIKDDVIIQTGFSTYEPKYCQWSKLIPYQQMVKNVADQPLIQPLITPTLRSASGQGKRPGGSLGSRTLRGVHDTMRK